MNSKIKLGDLAESKRLFQMTAILFSWFYIMIGSCNIFAIQ